MHATKYQEAQWFSGRVLDSRPRGRGFEPHRHHLCCVLEQDTLYPSLVLFQTRKTRPFITERLLMGRKESNQTNKKKNNKISNFPRDEARMFYANNKGKIQVCTIVHTSGWMIEKVNCCAKFNPNIPCAARVFSLTGLMLNNDSFVKKSCYASH